MLPWGDVILQRLLAAKRNITSLQVSWPARCDIVGEGDLLAGALDAELVEYVGLVVELVTFSISKVYDSPAMEEGGFVLSNACGAAKLIGSTKR